MVGEEKKYGLQIPAARLAAGRKGRPAQAPLKPKLGIFAAAEESDEEDNVESQIAAQQRHAHSLAKNEEVYKQALAQDPTAFDYDEVYDDFSARGGKKEKQREEKMQRQSKYIADLKSKATEREKEQEMVLERKMVRDAKKEEHLYGEKEKFITSSYRKKMEEEKEWKEREKRQEEEEKRNDVTKKAGMGDFYKNLLTTNVAFGAKAPAEAEEAKGEAEEAEVRRRDAAPREEARPPRPAAPKAKAERVAAPSTAVAPTAAPTTPARSGAGAEARPTASQSPGQDRPESAPPLEEPFVASATFRGPRAGYVFKKGPLGAGYYVDRPFDFAALRREGDGQGGQAGDTSGGVAGSGSGSGSGGDKKRSREEEINAARLRYFERKRAREARSQGR